MNVYWPLRERALNGDDRKTTDLLEDGVARENDDAVTGADLLLRPGSGIRRVRPHNTASVFVPRQLSYPASFLAAVGTEVYSTDRAEVPKDRPWYVELLIFTRRDAGSRWMASFVSGYTVAAPGPPMAVPVEIDQGFDAEPLIPDWVDPAQVHGMLVAYWQHWKNSGSEPADSHFNPGYWTTIRGLQIGQERNDTAGGTCDCYEHVEYRTDPRDQRWQFAWRSSAGAPPLDMVCSTVRIHLVDTPQPGRLLYQNNERTNWGAYLKPGAYRSLASEEMRQSCIEIGPTQAGGMGVVGGNGEQLNVTGVRAGLALPRPTFHLSGWLRDILIAHGIILLLAIPVVTIVLWRTSDSRSSA